MAHTQADPASPKVEDNALLASRLERTTARIEGILSGAEIVILDACGGPPLPGYPDDRIEKAEISLVLVNVALDLVRQMEPEFQNS